MHLSNSAIGLRYRLLTRLPPAPFFGVGRTRRSIGCGWLELQPLVLLLRCSSPMRSFPCTARYGSRFLDSLLGGMLMVEGSASPSTEFERTDGVHPINSTSGQLKL